MFGNNATIGILRLIALSIIILRLSIEYLKSLSNPQVKSLDSPALDELTKAVENQLKSLSL